MEMYGEDRARRRLGLPERVRAQPGEPLSANRLLWLTELLNDAPESGRLTPWERDFIASIATRFSVLGVGITLSDRQAEILTRIEGKIHAIG